MFKTLLYFDLQRVSNLKSCKAKNTIMNINNGNWSILFKSVISKVFNYFKNSHNLNNAIFDNLVT